MSQKKSFKDTGKSYDKIFSTPDPQNVQPDVSQDVLQNVQPNAQQHVPKDVQHNVSKDVQQDVSKDVSKHVPRYAPRHAKEYSRLNLKIAPEYRDFLERTSAAAGIHITQYICRLLDREIKQEADRARRESKRAATATQPQA